MVIEDHNCIAKIHFHEYEDDVMMLFSFWHQNVENPSGTGKKLAVAITFDWKEIESRELVDPSMR